MPYLHHVLIHFPVALGLLAALCALIARLRSDPFWGHAWRLLSYGTALVAILAVVTGLLSASHVLEGGVSAETIAQHRNAALGATALFVVTALAAWIGDRKQSAALTTGARVGSIAAAMAVGAAAHFGGEMLHPGMAPWSSKPHSHGTAAPHGHGGEEPADDHGHANDHSHDHDTDMDAGGHAGMAMPAVDAEATDGGSMPALAVADASAGITGRAAPAPTPSHVHQHGPGGRDATGPAPTPPASAAPKAVPPPPPATTGMPPDHKM